MSMRLAGCLVAVVVAITAVFAQGNQTLRVVPLVRDDHVLVSFELTGGLTDEVREAIRSGLKTTFTYTVELRLDVPAWVDRTISTATVATSKTDSWPPWIISPKILKAVSCRQSSRRCSTRSRRSCRTS